MAGKRADRPREPDGTKKGATADGRERAGRPAARGETARSATPVRAARIAHAIQQREAYLARGLGFLREIGVIDAATEKRLWRLYDEGDAATRRAVAEQVNRALDAASAPRRRGAQDPSRDVATRLDDVADDAEADDEEGDDAGMDVQGIADRVRTAGLSRFLGKSDDPSAFLRLLSDIPLVANRWRMRFLYVGALLLLLVAGLGVLGYFYPATIPYVGFFAVVLVVLLIAGLALSLSRRIHRTAYDLGVDLDVYAQLSPDDRRILFVRRIGLHVLDAERMGDAVEHVLGAVSPQSDPEEDDAREDPGPGAGGDARGATTDLDRDLGSEWDRDPVEAAGLHAVPPLVPLLEENDPPPRRGRGERFLRFAQRVVRSAADHRDDLEDVTASVRRGLRRDRGSGPESESDAEPDAEPEAPPDESPARKAAPAKRSGAKRAAKRAGARGKSGKRRSTGGKRAPGHRRAKGARRAAKAPAAAKKRSRATSGKERSGTRKQAARKGAAPKRPRRR